MLENLFYTAKDHNNKRVELRKLDWDCESLNKYLDTPLPTYDAPLNTIPFVSLDFETTGLDPTQDKVVSIGLVDLTTNQIDCSTLNETFVRNELFIRPETAVVNEILPNHIIEQGVESDIAFKQILEIISGKVIIAHNAKIESSFLKAHLKNYYRLKSLPFLFVDTLNIEKKYSYHGKRKLHTSYQLNDLRAHYNLPDYHAHSAASDALACAELFLAQTYKLGLEQQPLHKLLV